MDENPWALNLFLGHVTHSLQAGYIAFDGQGPSHEWICHVGICNCLIAIYIYILYNMCVRKDDAKASRKKVLMATTKKQKAEEQLKYYLGQYATCLKAGNGQGASLWAENFIGALTIYKIFTGATDQEIRDVLYPNK